MDITAPIRTELRDRGENIVSEISIATRMLVKNSDLREELMKSARHFAAQESHLQNSFELMRQMSYMTTDLKDKVLRIETSLQEVQKACDLFLETEKIYQQSSGETPNSDLIQNAVNNSDINKYVPAVQDAM
mmetsp:Transcript_9453/g.13025  ORF Transcript_9453/g.13025 Transcript_9453/m.13025 type:complete len:132 (+) Transcript_9453:73-468(+)